MAMYSLNVTIVRRSDGQSVVDRVAYITKARLYDSYTGRTYDRQSSSTDVSKSGVYLPVDAPPEYENIQNLLNALNSAETRSNAQMARSYRLALPVELTDEQQTALVKEFMGEHFARIGQCAIYAIHLNPANESGRDSLNSLPPVNEIEANPHVHLVVPFRMVNNAGFLPTKIASREMNNRKYLVMLRKSWADIQNRAFERLGLDVRVSHESLAMQGIPRTPARYLGTATIALEQKGIKTERGDQYRDIMQQNNRILQQDRSAERSYGPSR